jgi:hypothetical protein
MRCASWPSGRRPDPRGHGVGRYRAGVLRGGSVPLPRSNPRLERDGGAGTPERLMAAKRHRTHCGSGAFIACVPGMGDGPEVRVLPERGRRDRSEPQGADREGSTERSGVANPSSRRTETGSEALPSRVRAGDREALTTRAERRRSGGCAGKAIVLTPDQVRGRLWGDLALCLNGRRGRESVPWSETSAEAVVVGWGLREWDHLNSANRRIRTRTYGGGGGE